MTAFEGVIVGGVIGAGVAILSGLLAADLERRRRRRDLEIGQIEATVRVMDCWLDMALSLITGRTDKINRAEPELREALRVHWKWSDEAIPGTEAGELRQLATDIYVGHRARSLDDVGHLLELYAAVRASAARRLRELQ